MIYQLSQIEQYYQTDLIQYCLLIDIAIPDDSNFNTKKIEKLSKYKDMENKVSRMWKDRRKIVTVITGAIGKIKKGGDKNLQLLPGHPSATEMQKITLMSTVHIICKVLG
jgi:hypothetical protein